MGKNKPQILIFTNDGFVKTTIKLNDGKVEKSYFFKTIIYDGRFHSELVGYIETGISRFQHPPVLKLWAISTGEESVKLNDSTQIPKYLQVLPKEVNEALEKELHKKINSALEQL